MQKIRPLVSRGKGMEVNQSNCFDPSAPITRKLGKYLPHLQQYGKIYFITIRLIDSLPSVKLDYLKELRDNILNGNFHLAVENLDQYLAKIDYYLEQGYGECLLGLEDVQNVVRDALHFYDDDKFLLYDYVIMPNHLHMLLLPEEDLTSIIGSFKSFTAKKINTLLGRVGKIWQEDYFDRMIRNIEEYNYFADYIQHNPDKVP